MIKKIDITKFALFNEFSWDKAIGKNTFFKAVNIIYGRNYSGKTTLSRIFRCVEKNEIHRDYPDTKFSLLLDDDKKLTQENLGIVPDNIKIRVYNTDFIKENLSWLHKDDGKIEPFALLGSINIELDKKIKDIDEVLGKEGDKNGLYFELSEKSKLHNKKLNNHTEKNNALTKQLTDEAKRIKNNTKLYNQLTYNIINIKKDIPKAIESGILLDEVFEEKKSLLKDDTMNNISRLSEFRPKFSDFHERTNLLLTKEIKPSQTITDLINNSLLQNWVWQGIDIHKDKRNLCGFCGNPITKELWGKLDAHFNKESKILREDINVHIKDLEKANESINNYKIPSKECFYPSLYPRYENLLTKWQTIKKIYSYNLGHLIDELKKRDKNIFTVQTSIEISNLSDNIFDLFKEFNILIEEHNKKTTTLDADQQKARIDLRLSDIATFLQAIKYQDNLKEINRLHKEATDLENEKNKKQLEVEKLTKDKRILMAQAKDETKGAELVNQHLTRFFGHDGLTLVAEGESPAIKFKITRDGVEANNLSEGECSLIAFCYFIAKMEDELINNKPIIYIDDPISSLDSNHVFFMFSLIESVIAKPKKCGQLFISTHNLDFLKYLKRITVPIDSTSSSTSSSTSRKKDVAYFLIERERKQNNKRSVLTEMPSHIRNFSTEFNYLFGQIYEACKKEKGDKQMRLENTYSQYYNLPNNLRKFIECYLFFKYPNNEDPLDNLDKLFDGNAPSLINRIINENSHLTQLDRGWKPMDIDEVESCARLVIDKIEEKDPDQFEALVKSLG